MGRVYRRLASLMLVACCGATAWAADIALQPWRIEVDGGADAHGEIVFSFAEDGVEVTRIPVAIPIPKGTPENNVARRIRKELRRAPSKHDYGVDLDDGEIVLVSAKDGTRLFDIRLERNTVSGTEISVARE